MSRETGRMLPLQSAVPTVVADLLKRGEMSDEKMTFAWRTAVGSGIARVTTVRLAARGILEVVTADERWCRELKHSESVILARLESLLGKNVVTRFQLVTKLGESSDSRPTPRAPIPNPGKTL